MASILTTWTNNGRPGIVAASESGSTSLTEEIISRSPRGKLFEESRSFSQNEALQQLENWQLAMIIASSAFITAAVIVLAVWYHRRKLKTKTRDLNEPVKNQLDVVVVTSYDKPHETTSSDSHHREEVFQDDMSVYGSVSDSLPPSPSLSFKSVIEGPGLSRSRAGTGTSFGTVASLESVRSCRSQWGAAITLSTRYEEQLP